MVGCSYTSKKKLPYLVYCPRSPTTKNLHTKKLPCLPCCFPLRSTSAQTCQLANPAGSMNTSTSKRTGTSIHAYDGRRKMDRWIWLQGTRMVSRASKPFSDDQLHRTQRSREGAPRVKGHPIPCLFTFLFLSSAALVFKTSLERYCHYQGPHSLGTTRRMHEQKSILPRRSRVGVCIKTSACVEAKTALGRVARFDVMRESVVEVLSEGINEVCLAAPVCVCSTTCRGYKGVCERQCKAGNEGVENRFDGGFWHVTALSGS